MKPEKKEAEQYLNKRECSKRMLYVRDALDVLYGKWKLPILLSLTYGTKRFKQISNEVGSITDKVLSKELKDMETNQLIKRTVYDSFPPRVEYSITEHGLTLRKLIEELEDWGQTHRKKIIGK